MPRLHQSQAINYTSTALQSQCGDDEPRRVVPVVPVVPSAAAAANI